MLIALALKTVNAALFKALKNDPDTARAVFKLAPFRAVIQVEDLAFFFLVDLTTNTLKIEKIKEPDFSADLLIEGSASALLFSAAQLLKFKSWHTKNLQFNGDIETFKALFEHLAGIDLNLDGILSHYLGDSLAHLTRKSFVKARDWRKEVSDTLTTSILDFLQSELKWLPNQIEAQDFFDEVDALHARSERLFATWREIKKEKQG